MNSDSQRRELCVQRVCIALLGARAVVAVARRGSADGIKQRRRVAHRARERELVREAAHSLAHGGSERHAPAGRLEPDQSTPSGRNPD